MFIILANVARFLNGLRILVSERRLRASPPTGGAQRVQGRHVRHRGQGTQVDVADDQREGGPGSKGSISEIIHHFRTKSRRAAMKLLEPSDLHIFNS